MIVNLRGTHGSGKSTVARKILAKWGYLEDRRPGVKKLLGYVVDLPRAQLYIVGDYGPACGGADGIQPYSDIWPRVEAAAEKYPHVFFEGALISTTYGAIGIASEAWGDRFAFAFLDTPLDECVRRVNERRAERGADPIADTKNIASKHATIDRLRERLTGQRKVVVIDYLKPVTGVMKLLNYKLGKEPT